MIHYYQELIAFLRQRLGDRQVAADVAQEAFLRVLERTSPEELEHPRAFLFRTAMNLGVDQHRRASIRRSETLEVLEDETGPEHCSPEEMAIREQQLQHLQRALQQLPERCREAFLLRKVQGCSQMEIAERLGISRDMVEKHIVNAMKHCRLRLREWSEQD